MLNSPLKTTCAALFVAQISTTSVQASVQENNALTHGTPTSPQSSALNADERFAFNIPAGALSDVLRNLARQADVEIITSLPIGDLDAPALNGTFTVKEALSALLAPFEIDYQPISTRSYILSPPLALNEPNETASPPALAGTSKDEIVVRGFRDSLIQALTQKRLNTGVSEVILAEDIARFADLNLAEAIQRIPGVAITRVRGEGAEISLRGLNPDFTRVEFNGLEAVASSDRDRGFEFNVFASELFKEVEVSKSYRARLDEGGVAGTVNLKTLQPFDYSGFESALAMQLGTNTNARDLDRRFAGLLSNRNAHFGALLAIAYSDRQSEGQDASTFRYRARDLGEADISALPADLQTRLNNAEIFIPRGNRYRVSSEDQERLGVVASAQWRPNSDLEFSLDGLLTDYTVKRRAENIQTRGDNSFPTAGPRTVAGEVFGPTIVNDLRINDQDELVFADFSNAVIGTESTRQNENTTFYQIGLSGSWRPNEALRASGQAGHSFFEADGLEDKFYAEAFGGLTLDYSGRNRFDPQHQFGLDFDTADPSEWRAHEFDLSDSRRSNSIISTQYDLEYDLDDLWSIAGGVKYKRFANKGREAIVADALRTEWESGARDDSITDIGFTVRDHFGAPWIGVDVSDALAFFDVERDLGPPIQSSVFDIKEETIAFYVEGELSDAEWRGIIVDANFGLRYATLDRRTTGVILGEESEAQRIGTSSRDALLPAFNIAAEFLPDTVFRFGYSKNVTRPPITRLSPATTVRTTNFQDILTGNPDLRPFRSDNIDAYFERYFDELGYLAFGVFYKDIQNFITRASEVVPYGTTGLPLDLLLPSQNAATPFTFVTFINSQDATISGFEFAFKRDFDFLPGAWSNTGLIGNYTHANGRLDFVNLDGSEVVSADFPGLSRHSVNGTLYYEAARWGARASVAYRSDYITEVEVGLSDEDSRGQLSTAFVDVSAHYDLGPRAKLTLEGLNLTNQKELSYSDSSRRLTERRRSGATLFAGVSVSF